MSKISAYTENTAPSGDDDYLVGYDNSGTPATRKYQAKNATGGMLAHGDSVYAHYFFDLGATNEYYKLAQTSTTPSGTIRIKAEFARTGTDEVAEVNILLMYHIGTVVERVKSIKGPVSGTVPLGINGIVTYLEGDGSYSVYLKNTTSSGVLNATVELISGGTAPLPTVIAPNDTSAISSPTGSLSLDTTASPYSDGVPDGNEDWTSLTPAASYSGTIRYRRHANGLVEVQGDLTALGTTTDGTAITTTALPAGYRVSTVAISSVLTGVITGGVCGRIAIASDGTIKIYNYDTASANYRFNAMYMAEA